MVLSNIDLEESKEPNSKEEKPQVEVESEEETKQETTDEDSLDGYSKKVREIDYFNFHNKFEQDSIYSHIFYQSSYNEGGLLEAFLKISMTTPWFILKFYV